MKVPGVILVGGLAVGFAAGWLAGSKSASAQAPAVAETKAERPAATPLTSGATSISSEVERVAKKDRPDEGNKPMVKVIESKSEMAPHMKEIMERVQQQMKEKKARRVEERLAALKARLNLTPDQEAKVKELLEKSSVGEEGLTQFLSEDGKGGGAFTLNMGNNNGKSSDEQIAALLNPQQKEAYNVFQQEQAENRAEISANREMAQLQQQLTLSPEQKDQAFQALGNLARNEDAQGGNVFHPEAMQAKRKARIEALRPILTPEQMKVYENNPSMGFGGLGEGVSVQFSTPEPAK